MKIKINDYILYISPKEKSLTPIVFFSNTAFDKFCKEIKIILNQYDCQYYILTPHTKFAGDYDINIVFNNEDDFNIFLMEYDK